MKRGTNLPAGNAQVSSVWSRTCAACLGRRGPAREGAGAGGTQPVPCSLPAAAPEGAARAGQAEFAGKRARQELQTFKLEKWELVLFLEIGIWGGKGGKKGFYYICQLPQEGFLGCSLGGSRSVRSYFAIQDTHKKASSKM